MKATRFEIAGAASVPKQCALIRKTIQLKERKIEIEGRDEVKKNNMF